MGEAREMRMEEARQLRFCQEQALRLYAAGLEDEDFILLTTSRMTINEARAKLQLDPLDEESAGKLFFLEPTGIVPALKPATLRKAAEYWATVEAKLHADSLRQVMDERHATIREDLEKGIIDQEIADFLLSY